ncbi:MlaD family protein [Mycobacterium sp. pUA109]|uniref:MlaD family protein n=1 Tax=Mycobacterium sp. pUA109 TaxID=3238982 RepID=UPI00351B37E7
MGNSLDLDGRGPTDQQLLGYGLAIFAVIIAVTATLLYKSTGRLNEYVRVVADLVNVGDGLPSQSDVKYHELLVGSVKDVTPAAFGKPNYVYIDLKPQYAKDIPATVTARVVPSNVFAVSSVQLVDPGEGHRGTAIGNGAHIPEDQRQSTVIFQTTISKLRDLLAATGRGREDHSVGILAAVQAATENRRTKLLTAAGQLTHILNELDAIVATDPEAPSTVSALLDATRGLQSTAPDLVDALHQAIKPMQTFAETRAQLESLLAGSQNTLGTTRTAIDNHIDQLIQMSHDLTPALGVFAQNAHHFVPIFTRVHKLSDLFFENVWIDDVDTGNMRVNLSLTPTYTYTRADCPRYGELKGPSCYTAPLVAQRPDLPESMLPQNYHFPAGLEPPRGTHIGPDGNLIADGFPLVNPNPNLEDPNPPLPWWTAPAPRIPGTADPDLGGPPPPPGPPIPAFPPGPELGVPPPPLPPGPLPAEAAPASFGGNVGPVGSEVERAQLGVMTGQPHPASVATQLLLGPVARGMTVSLESEPAEGPK